MAKSYAVVQFEDTDDFSEVPSNWLFVKNKIQMCYWPSEKNISSLINKRVRPLPEWSTYTVTVICYCESLEKARKKAQGAETTSCDESKVASRGRGKRNKRKSSKYHSSSSSSNDDEDITFKNNDKIPNIQDFTDTIGTLTDINFPPVILVENNNPIDGNENNVDNDIDVPDDLLNNHIEYQADLNAAGVLSDGHQFGIILKKLDKVEGLCNRIKHYVKSVDDRLKILENKRGKSKFQEEFKTIQEKLPLNSILEVEELEKYIEIEENKMNLVSFIQSIGGAEMRDNTIRILKEIFTNELGTQCSWLGLRNNFRVSNLKIIEIIKGVIISEYPDSTQKTFEKISSEWFRLSRTRLNRKK